jgi:putative ABC transport system permease protein
MIKSYLKTAWRTILKHKGFSFINVFGLSLGIAACLLILHYVRFERSFDNFHAMGDRIFRLQQDRYNDGKLSTQWAAGAAGAGKTFKQALPEIESYAWFRSAGNAVISYNNVEFRQTHTYFANEDLLGMFSYPILSGKIKGALTEPNTAVITISCARKYFGSEDPMGKVLSRNKQENYKITGVMADMPENTHLKFDLLLSMPTFVKMVQGNNNNVETTFDWDGWYTYILVKPGANAAKVESKINSLVQQRFGAEMKAGNSGLIYHLQPLKDIHLTSHYMMEAEPNGNGKSVSFLLIISLFIIVIAWINYINLSTARAVERAREVGVRKVMGSHRSQLIGQFLMESLLVNLFAVLLATLIVFATLPLFNNLTGRQFSFGNFLDRNFWLALAGLFLIGTFLSGLYPAFVLSSFKPIAVLKGRLMKSRHGAILRHSLVVLQFAASIALVVGTFSVYSQLNFMRRQELGVNINQTLVLRGPNVTDSLYSEKLNAFKTEMLRIPGVTRVTASTEVPGNKVGWNAGGIGLVGGDGSKTNQYRVIGIDYDFLNAYGLKILKGRNFSMQYKTDPNAVLFNESAVKLLGFNKPEDAINKRIEFWGDQYTIIGVVSNHHQESLREAYDAHIFRLIPDARNFYSVQIDAGNKQWNGIVDNSKAKWANFFPGNPFEYFFLNDYYEAQYQDDNRFGQTFGLFAILAIIVSCMGLFGLASFITTQRTKEVGIRKVSGANRFNILLLLTKDFVKPILLALFIAIPVTYYLLVEWLQDYAFKMAISAWLFIVPAMLIILIALITITFQTIKVAAANPVNSLRTE